MDSMLVRLCVVGFSRIRFFTNSLSVTVYGSDVSGGVGSPVSVR